MSLPVGNPIYTTPTERLLYISFSLFTLGIVVGMVSIASPTDRWATVVFGETILVLIFGQTLSLSGAMSVLLIWAGLIVAAVAAVLHIAAQIIARSARRRS